MPKKELSIRDRSNLRSEEVQEIIGNPPHWLIRWGIGLFFAVLVMLLSLSWFIHYPDTVSADFTLTSLNAPKPVDARVSGKLTQLLVRDNTKVKKGQILGFIQSTANPRQVLGLDRAADSLIRDLNRNHVQNITGFNPNHYDQLGELQSDFQTFNQAFLQFKAYLASGYYQHKRRILIHDLNDLKRLHQNLIDQQKLARQDFQLSKDKFAVQATLAVRNVIAPMTIKEDKSQLLSKQMPLSQLKASIINNETDQNSKKDQLLELEKSISEQKITFLQALNTLKSRIAHWEYQYILRAPVSGKVSFISFLQQNQQVQAGQPLCYVKPPNTHYIGLMYIPQFNMGKIAKDDRVIIKFSGYPFQQYGSVRGIIKAISSVPKNSKYLVKVGLPDGLITDFGKHLTYREGMSATADIVTANRRLIEKFIYKIRKTALGKK